MMNRVSARIYQYIKKILFQEVPVILRFAKHILKPVGMVENVVAGIGIRGLYFIFCENI
jgi:hypothetical protein